MLTEEVSIFLAKTPPFTRLDHSDLKKIAKEVLMEFHPKGQIVLRQDGPAPDHLSVIRSGAVKVFVATNEGEEINVGYRSTGDFFGLLSFVHGDTAMDTVVATEDTSCYLIKKETVLALFKKNAEFSEYCFRLVLSRLADVTYKEIHDRTLQYGGGDKLLFTTILADFAVKKVISASEDLSIQQAAQVMAEHGVSSLVLLDQSGLPSGMITDRDLRNKVIAKGRDISGRVGDIMSVTIIKSEAGDYCYEALLKMIRYNIHHLLVVNKGELTGIITNHDLMMLHGNSPLSVAREIENQTTIDGLMPVARKVDAIISILIREGAKAGNITRIITEINDRLLRKILEIAETKLGRPPANYCWIVYGSEGRKEQTFKTDQDNAIIYDDTGADREEIISYFTDFAGSVKNSLVRCGFPPCKADCMASNPKWRQPLRVWKDYFSNWINRPIPEAILHSLIFFDFRPVHGDLLLAERLRAFLSHEARDKKVFLAHMAGNVVKNRAPLGFLGKIITNRERPGKGAFDVKINGLSPIIDAARLSALETGVYQTSTLARLMELKGQSGCITGDMCSDLEQAFEFLMSLRLRHQFQQIEKGIEPDNFINPDKLSVIDLKVLKESFKLIARVQDNVIKKYSGYMVM